HFAGKTRNPVECEINGDATSLVSLRPFDLAFLTSQIACVLHRSLETRKVDVPALRIDAQPDGIFVEQLSKPHFGLPKQSAGRHALPRRSTHERVVERRKIREEARSTSAEPIPSLIVHKADFPSASRQAKISVVDPQQ